MVDHLALRVHAAHAQARVDAFVVDAGQRLATIGV